MANSSLEMEVKEVFDYPEGVHTGEIVKVERREVVSKDGETFDYVDVHIRPDDNAGLDLKWGCPANLSKNTKLGKLLEALGVVLEPKTTINLQKTLVSKRISFMTNLDKNNFVRVLDNSIKLSKK